MNALQAQLSSRLNRLFFGQQASDEEKEAIAKLKELTLDTIKLEVEFQRDVYNMEKMFETKHNEIYEKRKKILDAIKRNKCGDTYPNENLTKFWLNVLKAGFSEFINKNDEKILAHLIDIRSELYNEPHIKFMIVFEFDLNEHFTDSLLTKTYYLNCLPDPEEPLLYDGSKIYKCEGCNINWKNQSERDIISNEISFFDFFSPPELPEDLSDANYDDISAVLQSDFEMGFYLKERIIPKAVMFFTGEIRDCQILESDSEPEETEESASGGYDQEEIPPNEN